MWVNNKPTHVKATPESVNTNYNILKQNLPIPLGIDHLKPEILTQNPILQKLNLLNVGEIQDIQLENNQIKITKAEIKNPSIQELYDKGELPSFSIVSELYGQECPTGQADLVEKYSVIKRVDFVEKGACIDCTVDYETKEGNAKAIIGDDTLAEVTLKDLKEVITKLDGLEDIVKTFDERLKTLETLVEEKEEKEEGEEETEETKEKEEKDGGEGTASNADKRIQILEQEIKKQKAAAQKAEAQMVVNKYIKEGKIKPKNVEKHIAMAMKTPEDYQAIMDDAPVIIDMNRKSTPGEAEAQTPTNEDVDEYGDPIDLQKTVTEMTKIIGDD